MQILSVSKSEQICTKICNKFIIEKLEVSDENIRLEILKYNDYIIAERTMLYMIKVIKSLVNNRTIKNGKIVYKK